MPEKVEILSPVGDRKSLKAAVENGADAVYFGVGKFNARRRAENFTIEELRDAVEYAHDNGVKIYNTFNILRTKPLRGNLERFSSHTGNTNPPI